MILACWLQERERGSHDTSMLTAGEREGSHDTSMLTAGRERGSHDPEDRYTHTSYIFMSLSSEAVTSSCESGEKQRDLTGMAWPSSVCSRAPVSVSNTLMIPSTAPDATSLPSGLW